MATKAVPPEPSWVPARPPALGRASNGTATSGQHQRISDFRDGELEEIVQAIRDAAPDLEVTLEDPQRTEKGR